MSTLDALLKRPELGLRLLTPEAAHPAGVESALVIGAADLAGWPASDLDALQRVLVILPLSPRTPPGPILAAVRRLGRLGGEGVTGAVVACGLPEERESTLQALTASACREQLPLLLARDEPSRVGARIMKVVRDERARAAARAVDDYREMHREAARPDGLPRLLRWLARRVAGSVVLLDGAGAVLHAFPGLPGDVLEQAAGEVDRVLTGRAGSAAADLASGVVHVEPIGTVGSAGVLVVTRHKRFSPDTRSLIGDASRLLGLHWIAEGGARGRRAELAEAQTREAVLHLLMTGHLDAARRVAVVLGPSLAEEVRVYIVECPTEARDEAVSHCERASGWRAWIVRCPVYTRHIIVLAPASDTAGLGESLRAHAGRRGGVNVGVSDVVALREVASAYGQAFHALAVARGSAEGYARFSPRGDLAALVRPRGYAWARATLEPLSGYRPKRAQDPDAAELTVTLQSWLDFFGGAARQLKIHRNTLAARLRHIERLFGRPLQDLETQSRLHLALRVLDGPDGGGDPVALDVLLDDPEVRRWADTQVSPLLQQDPELYVKTLRVWLANDARIEATAAALGISVPGTRKRLTRVEETLGRSLLSGPSARYDLWFALRVHGARPEYATGG
ncbi:hypothetical protein GCM10010191_50590 [Actinomadura vinacea]|uniref:PucR C-terminal helix-turn-helix domain-containing protein n=1 Tax=Actinomadura vinacea TaxID=115336 RepID=A0ABP5WML0_9ACTN